MENIVFFTRCLCHYVISNVSFSVFPNKDKSFKFRLVILALNEIINLKMSIDCLSTFERRHVFTSNKVKKRYNNNNPFSRKTFIGFENQNNSKSSNWVSKSFFKSEKAGSCGLFGRKVSNAFKNQVP